MIKNDAAALQLSLNTDQKFERTAYYLFRKLKISQHSYLQRQSEIHQKALRRDEIREQ